MYDWFNYKIVLVFTVIVELDKAFVMVEADIALIMVKRKRRLSRLRNYIFIFCINKKCYMHTSCFQ